MLAFKNLQRRPARTLLSLLGVSIGIAAIIAFNAIGQGFREGINAYLRDSGAQMVVVNRTMKDPAFSRVTKEEQDFIRGLPEIDHLSRANLALASPRGLKEATRLTMLPVFGRTRGDRLMEKYRRGLQGRLPQSDDEILLGSIASEDLKKGIGDSLELFGRRFTVVGVFRGSAPWEKGGAVMSNAILDEVLQAKNESVYMGFLYLRPGADPERVSAAVAGRFPHLEAMKTEEFMNFYDQVEYIDWFVWIISLVSVAVGGLGVLNTLLMSVSERTREIGTLRAVGWSQRRVLRLILAEGVLISVLGGLIGLGFGVAGAEILIRFAPMATLSTVYGARLFAQAFSVALGLGFLGSLYPAWRASRLSPIEALKYE
ncbi:MAG TPA: FtsX-like permease family protein [Planctomycetota bacterium]|nr:FtsX-like permease family protein [Planctomycetota bacterium]